MRQPSRPATNSRNLPAPANTMKANCPMPTSRRDLMRRALQIAAAATALPAPVLAAAPVAAPRSNPFSLLGVASGDPTATGVVLWCRLALDLADVERWGLTANAYRVTWEVRPADKPNGRPIRSGTAIAAREKGYAVHVEVTGLQPAQSYAYRFRLGDFEAAGNTRTAPRPDVMAEKLRFFLQSRMIRVKSSQQMKLVSHEQSW